MTAAFHPDRNARRFVTKDDARPINGSGVATSWMRLQNTLVAWSEASLPAKLNQEGFDESFVILPDVGATLAGGGETVNAPARSVCILPTGPIAVELTFRVGSPTSSPQYRKDSAGKRSMLRTMSRPALASGPSARRCCVQATPTSAFTRSTRSRRLLASGRRRFRPGP